MQTQLEHLFQIQSNMAACTCVNVCYLLCVVCCVLLSMLLSWVPFFFSLLLYAISQENAIAYAVPKYRVLVTVKSMVTVFLIAGR